VFRLLESLLEETFGGVNCLVVWLALNCWEYWVREYGHNVLDSGILHFDLLGGPECLSMLLMRKRCWTGVPKKTTVVIAGYSIMLYCISNV
jgi:hypothetical protein